MSPAYFSFRSICAFQYVYFEDSYALVFLLNLSLTEFRNGRKSAYFHEIAELDRTESLKMVYISILIRHHYREVSTTLFYSHMSHTPIFGGLFNLVDDVRCIYRQCCLLIFKWTFNIKKSVFDPKNLQGLILILIIYQSTSLFKKKMGI